jgi:TonB family protein
MKNFAFCTILFIALFTSSTIGAQTEASATNVNKSPVTAYLADRNARFPDLSEYLSKNLVYPKLAHENSLEGTVKAEVRLNETGKITEVRILTGMGSTIDNQVIQLLLEMPHWTPAVRNGKTISQRLIVPLKFSLI